MDSLSLSNRARAHDNAGQRVIIPRIIPCASDDAINLAAQALFTYTIGIGTFAQTTEVERAEHVLHLLFRADRMDPDATRTIVYIMVQFLIQLGGCRMDLAAFCLEIASKEVIAEFEKAWVAENLHYDQIGGGSHDLSMLKYFSAMLSELYAFQLVGPEDFLPVLDRVLAPVSGPVLTKTFIYEVMSRALTNNAPKLPPCKWEFIRMKWSMLAREDPRVDPVGRTKRDIDMFTRDSEKGQRDCGIPFIVGTSEDLEVLCLLISNDVFELGAAAELERRSIEEQHAAVTQAFGAVCLG